MKKASEVLPKRYRTSRYIHICVLVCGVLVSGATAFGQEAEKSGGLVCDDTTCRGLYDEVLSSVSMNREGHIYLIVTPEVTPFLAASSQACARDTYVVLQFEGESSAIKREQAKVILNQLQVARVMGYEVKIEWEQSNASPSWMVCQIVTVIAYGPPAP